MIYTVETQEELETFLSRKAEPHENVYFVGIHFVFLYIARKGEWHQSIFDADNLGAVQKYVWAVTVRYKPTAERAIYYAIATTGRKSVFMHNYLFREHWRVSHRDENGLNNARYNIEAFSPAELRINDCMRKRGSMRNIHFHRFNKAWCVKITRKGRIARKNFTSTELEAAKEWRDKVLASPELWLASSKSIS